MELTDFKPKADIDLFGQERTDMLPKELGGILAKRFAVVPFSVLDARAGYWQQRKREWIALGIKGEEGRQDTAGANNICSEQWGRGAESDLYSGDKEYGAQQTGPNSPYRTFGYQPPKPDPVPGGGGPNSVRRLAAKDAGRCFGQDIAKGENPNFGDGEEVKGNAGTSVFDPVLCESMYKWFCPPAGKVLDPFAGESTKGIIASFLGYNYLGVELRDSQIEANIRQAGIVQAKVKEKSGEDIPAPKWVRGDSSQLESILDEHAPFEEFDFIWTSPPYFDLEIYSASEKDGSAFETYEKFMAWYKLIFSQAVARLKPNRFLAVKVGEIRDDSPSGFYRNFEADNIRVFEELGLRHYNRIVLVTPVGSLPVRIGTQFPKYRKVGNTHQMIYIFWKGPESIKCIPRELGILAKEDITRPEEQ
jgi:DNA modification methylase